MTRTYPVPELNTFEKIWREHPDQTHLETLTTVRYRGHDLPVQAMRVGNAPPSAPALLLTGGVHGLERIGTQVLLAFLKRFLQRLTWDHCLQAELTQLQLFLIPAVNPSGMLRHTRSNGNGVDLMRNAPLDAEDKVPPLLGGHRFSTRLPWYRGNNRRMEPEALALCQFVRKNLFSAPFSLVLDCHSGFGLNDQLWFPYAYSKRPMAHLAEIHALKELLQASYPQHFYVFEPQNLNYGTHGDLWDYLYLESLEHTRPFLPLTLEMGSWAWIRKNPFQMARLAGFFHPIMPHRLKRVLRRHLLLLDFLVAAVRSHEAWLPASVQKRRFHEQQALRDWYASGS